MYSGRVAHARTAVAANDRVHTRPTQRVFQSLICYPGWLHAVRLVVVFQELARNKVGDLAVVRLDEVP